MDANFTGGDQTPDVFYALGCVTRTNAPFNDAKLRIPAYVDMTKAESGQPIVGPTLNMERGKTTGVLLKNAIQGCGADAIPGVENNMSGWKPHDFTSTNLHTHGLHVSPQAPSDDVLIILDSKHKPHSLHAGHEGGSAAHHTIRSALDATSYAYRYELPADHPVGTFWYHPHKHGSVAAQVGPGMAGALIVTAPDSENDFDTLLATTCKITASDEEIVVLQSISYFETTGGAPEQGVFYPYGYYVGAVEEGFDASTCHGLTPTKAAAVPALGVNGQVNPVITMDQGEIKRLRFVNASNGQTVVPQFVGEGAAPEVYAIAVDGIALLPPTVSDATSDPEYFKIDYDVTKADPEAYWTNAELITLAPGQRLDLLVKAGTAAGSFQLKGAAKGTVPMVVEGQDPNTADILTVTVTAQTSNKNQSIPTVSLFETASIKRPVPPVVDIGGIWPAATQSIEFKTIEENFTGSYPSKPAFVVNDQYFDVTVGDPAQIQLFKGDTDVWNVYSTNDAHIFHIHINSFQALGRSTYDATNRVYSAPVTYKMPIWRDTIYVDSVGGEKIPGSEPTKNYDTYTPGTMVTMASKQVDFTGEFVLHCHNLFHEDNGMMVTVSILDPETGGTDSE
ncbi:MAG: multicopper oxidase family protein [Thalassovita sp.]